MKQESKAKGVFISIAGLLSIVFHLVVQGGSLPEEQLLWGKRLKNNPIAYSGGEKVRSPKASNTSPSGMNRVISQVGEASYAIHRAPAAIANGVGLVICPGGGYVDVWLDREGHDLGIWLASRGITSLVLKYRTNSNSEKGERRFDWETYLPAVVADARESIALLRREANDLGLDPEKIGVAGYSAGGHLAFSAGYDSRYWSEDSKTSGQPNFVGLFYPWLWEGFEEVTKSSKHPVPTFIMNGGPDKVTPASKALSLYQILLEKEVPSELHVFGKGNHGFDLGDGAGQSAALWKVSFVAWLQDMGWINYSK